MSALFSTCTGECLLGCGGDAAGGHVAGCEAVEIEAELARLREFADNVGQIKHLGKFTAYDWVMDCIKQLEAVK